MSRAGAKRPLSAAGWLPVKLAPGAMSVVTLKPVLYMSVLAGSFLVSAPHHGPVQLHANGPSRRKVVYYGPAQSGKTTNLEQIHRLTDPAGNNRLISLNTAQDRTLFFDLLPFSLGARRPATTSRSSSTPSPARSSTTRPGASSWPARTPVVFVADSRKLGWPRRTRRPSRT